MQPQSVTFDPSSFSPDLEEILKKLRARTVGQDHAVEALGRILETFLAGYNDPNRPVGVVLELGPTGTGKTWSLHPAAHKITSRGRLTAPAHSWNRSHILAGFSRLAALTGLVLAVSFHRNGRRSHGIEKDVRNRSERYPDRSTWDLFTTLLNSDTRWRTNQPLGIGTQHQKR
jgi:hypothetical protein